MVNGNDLNLASCFKKSELIILQLFDFLVSNFFIHNFSSSFFAKKSPLRFT
ncbi:Uncharacterised protein [Mycobacteroides abscessus subsp. abscessus]|nr:Uncharacterised protein [Mycobacteroides abscessus subsp. abscessus]